MVLFFLCTKGIVYSQAVNIVGLDAIYCINDPPDTIFGQSPPNKSFTGPGITQIIDDPATAIFDPAIAGTGTHIITYFTRTWEVVVVDAVPANLDPFPQVCENDPAFVLGGGSPEGGIYAVNGVDASIFDPSTYPPGDHWVTYRTTGCESISPPQAITVREIPDISFSPIPDICIDANPLILDHAFPAGGVYTGPGVSSGTFDPAVAGTGTHTILYTYSDGYCTNQGFQTITVEDLPVVYFSGLDTLFCDTDPPVLITGSPASTSGYFSGNGISDNGDGTAYFDPSTSGLGYHQISYTYSTPTGCTSSYTRLVRVGTLLRFSGLEAKYCTDNSDVFFTYSPPGGTFNSVTGLTDNLDGTAVLSPSEGSPGVRIIHYTYTDINGCVNHLQKTVEIAPLPDVNFTGLDPAGYCNNADPVQVTGNHSPSGTFSGPGITDNVNGTALWNPMSLPVGGPYEVEYTYTDPVTGCDNSVSKSSNILPIPEAEISGDQVICYGESANLTVKFTGDGPFDFTYTDGLTSSEITGSGDIYNLILSPEVTSVYTIETLTQANGCSNSGNGQGNIKVNPFPEILVDPVSKTVCQGDNISFSISASGTGLTYQWQKDGVEIPGETSSVIIINDVDSTDAGSYSCIVRSTCGPDITSNPGLLTVQPQTVVTIQPFEITDCEGQNIDFIVQANGSDLSFQWIKNGVNITDATRISGSNSQNLSISDLITNDAGVYSCEVIGDCGKISTDPANLSVYTNILITNHPKSKTVCPGDNISFFAGAEGSSLSYQWQYNSVDIPGATDPFLSLSNVDAGDAGNYRCIITGDCGEISSDAASLTVHSPVSINIQPENISVCEGSVAEMNIMATGSNLSYQWKMNGIELTNGGDISGVNSSSLKIINLTSLNEGAYTCEVSGSCGSLSSSAGILLVDENISILHNPVSQNACPGDNIIMSTTADGTNLTYQWYKNSSLLSGMTSGNLIISSVSDVNEGDYYAMISNSCGSLGTDIAKLIISLPTVINVQPSNVEVCEGDNGSFKISASGSDLGYQWLRNGIPLSDGGSFTGTQSSELFFNNVSVADAGTITCSLIGNCGTINSDPANFTVNENIRIDLQPQNRTVCQGSNVIYEISASGTNLNYQWQFDENNLMGETGNTLILTDVSSINEGNYRCIVTGECGSITSNSASLKVEQALNILSGPISQQLCEDNNVSFTVSAKGTNLSYQWKKNGADMSNDAHVSGSQSNTLNINNIRISDQAVYSCNISSSCGTSGSPPADLTVYPHTEIITQPTVFNAVENGNASFSIATEGDNLSYQWYKEGIAISGDADYSGEKTSILTISNITENHAGSYYCIVTGSCGTVTSDPGVLVVNLLTIISLHPSGPLEKCENESVGFDVVASGTNLSYQWKKDGNDLTDNGRITGSNSPNLFINNVLIGDEGYYSCLVSGDEGIENSYPALLGVHAMTDVNLQPVSANMCEGENGIFVINSTGTINSYQWKKDGVSLSDNGRISGSGTNTLTISNLTMSDNGSYICELTGVCENDVSDPAIIEVNPNTLITAQPVSQNKCAGTSVNFNIEATGGDLSFQWKKDGTDLNNGGNISGANSPGLSITNLSLTDAGSYTCHIMGNCGKENSQIASLTVSPETFINTNPSDMIRCEGDDVFFDINSEGTNLTYEWWKDGIAITEGTRIKGSSASVLLINDLIPDDEGTYQVFVRGSCGDYLSDPAVLSINDKVSILTQPSGDNKCIGENVRLSIVSGNDTDSYQWKKNGIILSDGGHYLGSNTANLNITDLDLTDAGVYSCLVTGSCNSLNSGLADLTVNETTQINIHPLSQNVNIGDPASFSVNATGDNLSYQWIQDGIHLADNLAINGVNSAVLQISTVESDDEGAYTVNVTGTCENSISDPALLSINEPTLLITSPSDQILCEGQAAMFRVEAEGTDLKYEWRKNGNPVSEITGKISGAKTNTLTVLSTGIQDEGVYTCRVSGKGGTVNSGAANLVVNQITVITDQPDAEQVKCTGESAFFTIQATGDDLTYSWEKDGIPLVNGGNVSGAESDILSLSSMSIANSGIYRCLVTGTCGNIISESSTLNINELPGIPGTVSGDDLVCQEETSKAYEVPAIGNAISYEWTLPFGAEIVSGAGSRRIVVDYSTDGLSGEISVHGRNNCGTGPESVPLLVTVNQKPEADAGFDQNLCSNSTTLNANNTSYGTWSRGSGFASFTDPSQHNTMVTNLAPGINSLIWTVTENNCTSRDTLKIVNNIVKVEAGEDQVFCRMTTSLNAKESSQGKGQWSIELGGANFASLNDPETEIINIQRGTNVLKWSVNNKGCISSDTVTITNDLPDNAFAGNDTIILSDTHTLEAGIPSIGTGRWTLVSGAGVIENPDIPVSAVTNIGVGENIFKWTVNNNACYSEDEVRIINYTPTVNDAGAEQNLCQNSTKLEAIPPLYGTGQWTIVQGSGTFSNAWGYDTEVYNLGKGENIFRWTIYEYEVTSDDVKIINNSPSGANAGIDQSLCDNTTLLSANHPIVGTGEWTIAGGYALIDQPSEAITKISDLNHGSSTFRWTVKNGNCSTSDEVIITNNLPSPAMAGDDQTSCEDSITLYPNNPTIGTGEWSVISGAGNFIDNKAYNLGINDNIFKWTISHKGCKSSDTVIITSNKPTEAFTGPAVSTCHDSILLSGNTPLYGTGTWSVLSGSANIEDVNDPNSPARDLANGINKFRWTINYQECMSVSDITVSYDLINANAGQDQTLCGNTATLTANTPLPGSGIWTVVGGAGSANFDNSNQPNTQVTDIDRGANVLRWTITNNGCTSYDEVTITNNDPSPAYAGADRSVCGESFSLNANEAQRGTGEWSVLSGSASITDPQSHNSPVNNLSLGNNSLRWTVTHEDCISTDEVIILNDQPANVSAGADQYICSDSTQLYSSEAIGGDGRWSIAKGSASFENNLSYNSSVYNLEKGENKLVWTVTISGCSASDTVVIMNNMPSIPSAGPDQDNCSSDAIMAANSPLIGTGKWSVVSGSAQFEDPTNPLSPVTSAGNGLNLLRWTTVNGNCSLSDDVKIYNSLPTLAYAGKDREVCNTTANLLANPPISGTGTWKVVSGFGIIENPSDYNTQINNLGFGQNTIRWTTENGRCKTSDDIIITNNLAKVNAGEDKIVYSPSVNLVGNKPASGIGEWKLAAGSGIIESSSNFETRASSLGEGANTFYWTIDNHGCIASDDIIVSYYEMPGIDFSPSTIQGCPPLSIDFINSSIGGYPYKWDFGDGTTSNKTNPSHVYTLPGSYSVQLTGTGPDGIMVTKDTIITVSDQPLAEMDISPETVYISDNPEQDEPVYFFTLTHNADSVIWDFGDGTFSSERNPIHLYQDTGTYDVNLQVITGHQCYDSKTRFNAVRVEKKGSLQCPNAFTPHMEGSMGKVTTKNDYSNDLFHCYGTGMLEYRLEIYNRLGILLFETSDINIGWDGYFQGKLVEEGVYVYQVSGRYNNGEAFSEIGNIVLIHQD